MTASPPGTNRHLKDPKFIKQDDGSRAVVITFPSNPDYLGIDSYDLADYFDTLITALDHLRSGRWDVPGHQTVSEVGQAITHLEQRLTPRLQGLRDALIRAHYAAGGTHEKLALAMDRPRQTAVSRGNKVRHAPPSSWETWARREPQPDDDTRPAPIYPITYTHPSVLAAIEAGADWAEAESDPTRIDWSERVGLALIPFDVVDGRPVNPLAPTHIRYGRNELGHWGPRTCADVIAQVYATTGARRRRWIILIERADGYGWAVPGGYAEHGESLLETAIREFGEEVPSGPDPQDAHWRPCPARVVPDPRASDEAWLETVPFLATWSPVAGPEDLPTLTAGSDARSAKWFRADTYDVLDLAVSDHGGEIFAAHQSMLADILG